MGEKVNAFPSDDFQRLCFTFGGSRHHADSLPLTGSCERTIKGRTAPLLQRGAFVMNNRVFAQIPYKYDIQPIHLCPLLCFGITPQRDHHNLLYTICLSRQEECGPKKLTGGRRNEE